MKFKITCRILSFCLILPSCNPNADLKAICQDSSLETNEYLGNLYDLTLLTDFDQALDCAQFSEKY